MILLSKRSLRAVCGLLLFVPLLTHCMVAEAAVNQAYIDHASKPKYLSIKLKRAAEKRPVYVRGYTKKNGTHVAPHTRSSSGTRRARISARTDGSYRQKSVENRNAIHTSVQRDQRGRIHRSTAAKSSFQRQRPCPSTGSRRGRCPGYVVDHVKPLECGGQDAPSNMQWQTTADAKAKDRTERLCR
jgi:hypothetical protein